MAEEKRKYGTIEAVDPSPKEAKTAAYDFAHMDISEVKGGNPAMEYYWARNTSPSSPGGVEWEKLYRGFETCSDPSLKALGKRPDGTYQVGDMILMQRSKEVAEAERKQIEEVEKRRLRKIDEELKEAARRAGIKIYKTD